MSISTHILAFRDMDGEFYKMLKAKKFCEENELTYPKEVIEYFKGMEEESEETLRHEFLTVDLDNCLMEWKSEYAEGYELDIK